MDLPVADTLQFLNEGLKFNGKLIGSYELDNEERILSIMLNGKSQPAFALYKIDSAYHYRYTLDNEEHLQLTTLDEREGDSLITVEGKALLLEAL
ncbi:hypothetical protein [Sphingobacterium deserti]|uniref:Uncharacterized protein n=1 Tax=Sphingobacterium deserti TaxID=1229276 RepID=A0A0B8T292_9SPHI|nr:hypothetical protein [Sphingobacterium deserti]KGE12933.1 hypothetical protein DI53_3370 [Sphingobacterium deserti]